MNNFLLKIAYDGSNFFGWQETDAGPSIEAALRYVLEKILNESISLQAASRTDRGVHADCQIVNFLTKKNICEKELMKSLNALLPKDISVLVVKKISLDFHPSISALKKTYIYHICQGPYQLPKYRHYSWHVPYSLNIENMKKSAAFFIGSHDFSAFCNYRKNLNYEHKFREIYNLEIFFHEESRLRIEISGNHFLYKMVRNIVGTLIYVGRNKIAIGDISKIFASKHRHLAGITAPAHGLFLHDIFYPKEILI